MTNAKTAKSTPDAAIPGQAVSAKPAGNFDKQQPDRQQIHLADLIDTNTRGVLTLFPFKARAPAEGKTYPVMTGHIDTRRVKVPVSAFEHLSEEGRVYLSLSIGLKDQNHLGGAVFRQEEQNPDSGRWELTPGKENDRWGVLNKQIAVLGSDAYETVFELRFYGKRLESKAGVYYIKAQVYPERKDGVTAAGGEAKNDCF
jgi:hypothetical protein